MYNLAPWLALVPLVFVVMFVIVGGINLGLPLAGLVKGRPLPAETLGRIAPLWESTVVFLVAALGATFSLFPAAFAVVGPLVAPLWVTATLLLAARVLLLAAGAATGGRALRLTLVVVSLLVPVVLAQNITVLLTGESDLWQHAGLAIALGALAATFPPALWGGYFYLPGAASRSVARTAYWLALLLTTFTLPLAIVLDANVLDGRSLLGLMWPLMAAGALGIACLASERRRRYFLATATLVVGVALTLYLTLWPFILRPVLRLDTLIVTTPAQIWLAAAFAALVAVVTPALYLLHRSVTTDER